ncbi:hypothetical protein LR48_Vigan10g240000 [Vigna angularis]|uniref:Uncharacterized protein n=1 Tax=Phaseolus angularis TaxID=3914 RepID=A0A0L9VNI4_PHAAN|nr:hypothetical protein LR48_Vigan10g240000 [Vigna angularis]
MYRPVLPTHEPNIHPGRAPKPSVQVNAARPHMDRVTLQGRPFINQMSTQVGNQDRASSVTGQQNQMAAHPGKSPPDLQSRAWSSVSPSLCRPPHTCPAFFRSWDSAMTVWFASASSVPCAKAARSTISWREGVCPDRSSFIVRPPAFTVRDRPSGLRQTCVF